MGSTRPAAIARCEPAAAYPLSMPFADDVYGERHDHTARHNPMVANRFVRRWSRSVERTQHLAITPGSVVRRDSETLGKERARWSGGSARRDREAGSLGKRCCARSLLNPCESLRYNARRRHVSAPAFFVNPWVGGFRCRRSTSGNDTVLEILSHAQQRLFRCFVRSSERDSKAHPLTHRTHGCDDLPIRASS